MDLDYRALSNAGLWSLGRLQTDADRHRVLDGIATNDADQGTGFDLVDPLADLVTPRDGRIEVVGFRGCG